MASAVTRPSAVATVRPRWMSVDSQRMRPVSPVIAREKLTLNSSVVYATPAGSVLCTAHPIDESSSVAASPPWTTPIGL